MIIIALLMGAYFSIHMFEYPVPYFIDILIFINRPLFIGVMAITPYVDAYVIIFDSHCSYTVGGDCHRTIYISEQKNPSQRIQMVEYPVPYFSYFDFYQSSIVYWCDGNHPLRGFICH